MFFLPRLFLSLPRLTLSFLMSGLMILAILYAGFAVYVLTMKPHTPDVTADAVIVLTGGPGRVQTGFDILMDGKAHALLITGVHPGVKLTDLTRGLPANTQQKLLSHCCISLGYAAESTADNALEAAEWALEQDLPEGANVLIVTSDFHMPRAMLQFERVMTDTNLYSWPVASNSQEPSFWRNLTSEFGKMLLGIMHGAS